MYSIDFSTPVWFVNYYHCIGVVSICLNILGIYLLTFESVQLGKFWYYLLILQIITTLTDTHLTFLMQPIPLSPLIAGYTVGVLPSYFDLSTHFSMTIFIFLGCVQLETLTFCFGQKHQALANIIRKHVLPNSFLYFLYFLCIICPFILCAWFQLAHASREDQLDYIQKTFPELVVGFKSLKNFEIYERTSNVSALLLTTFVGGATLLVMFLLFVYDIFKFMRMMKKRHSTNTFRKHQQAIQSLMVQLATASLCLGPPCVFIITLLLNWAQSQLLSQLVIAWAASHSSVNMISLIIFFPPHRKFIMRKFGKPQKQNRIIGSSVIF